MICQMPIFGSPKTGVFSSKISGLHHVGHLQLQTSQAFAQTLFGMATMAQNVFVFCVE